MSRAILRLGTVLICAATVMVVALVLYNGGGEPADFAQDYFAARAHLDGESIYAWSVAVGFQAPLVGLAILWWRLVLGRRRADARLPREGESSVE